MVKVNYDKKTGKVIAFNKDIEPFIMITEEERNQPLPNQYSYYAVIDGKFMVLCSKTDEEIEQIEADKLAKREAIKAHTQLSAEEVLVLLTKQDINNYDISEAQVALMVKYYPTFDESIGKAVAAGYKFSYENKMYKTAQALTIQAHYPPSIGTEALYTRIDEIHLGNKYDAIPYEGNMILECGKYYTQDNVIYLCIRDTINPVFNPLKELVGLYVEVA